MAIYGVRGSGQDYLADENGMGPEMHAVAEEILRRIPATMAVLQAGVPYPAESAPWGSTTGLGDLSPYNRSVESGAELLVNGREDFEGIGPLVSRCSGIQLVLVGLSQGAQVITTALAQAAGPTPVTDRIAAVLLYGNPVRTVGQPYDVGADNADGILSAAWQQPEGVAARIPAFLGPATRSYCLRDDPVCAFTAGDLAAHQDIHLAYAQSLFALDGATFASERVLTSTQNGVPGATVSVAPCPIPPDQLAGVSLTPPAIPTTTTVSPLASPPEGTQVFGTTEPGDKNDYLSLGPVGYSCQPGYGSADGGLAVNLGDPAHEEHTIRTIWSPGGLGPSLDLACPYIPAARKADEAFRGSFASCTAPPEDSVAQLPTGSPDLFAAAVKVPPNVKDPAMSASGNGSDATVAVFTARAYSQQEVSGQEADCTLPSAQQSICAAALSLFLTLSAVGHLATARDRASMVAAIHAFLGVPGAPTDGTQGLPFSPAPQHYVALGDSYSSGEGTNDYFDETSTDTDRCHRSPEAADSLLGVQPSDFRACSGATSNDVINGKYGEASQLSGLDPSVDLVTLSVGGDDLGFSSVLDQCIDIGYLHHGRSDQDCRGAIDSALHTLQSGDSNGPPMIDRLTHLLSLIHAKAPGARIMVIGYPRLFPVGGYSGGCNGIHQEWQGWLNDAASQLDDTLQAATLNSGVAEFVDTYSAFDGHEVCGHPFGNTDFVNDLQLHCPVENGTGNLLLCSESFHPTKDGYRQLRAIIFAQLESDLLQPSVVLTSGTTNTVTASSDSALDVNGAIDALSIQASWPGSSVRVSVISPSGRVIGPSDRSSEVREVTTATSWAYLIQRPERGRWAVRLFGAVVQPGGEHVLITVRQIARLRAIGAATPGLGMPTFLKVIIALGIVLLLVGMSLFGRRSRRAIQLRRRS